MTAENLFEDIEAADEKVTRLPRRSRVRTSQSTKKQPAFKPKSLESEIGGLLTVMNFGFFFLPQPWQGDALDSAEIEVLAKTINSAAMDNPIIYKYLSWAFSGGGSTINLIMVAGIIVGKRAARHGVIPADYEAGLTMMLGRLGASEAAVKDSLGEAEDRDNDTESA